MKGLKLGIITILTMVFVGNVSAKTKISVEQNLNNGVDILEILEENNFNNLYGIEFGGGFIFNVNQVDGSLIVATDYSQIGSVAWGDVFSLDTNTEIGSGGVDINDGYVEKWDSDGVFIWRIGPNEGLDYNNNKDYLPSKDSMQAIYDNVHAIGMGDFNENLTYWTSTKVGYAPFVMNFNISWGGIALPGLCTNANGIMIVREL